MLDKYSDVLENKLGTFTSAKVKLTLKDDSQTRFLTGSEIAPSWSPMRLKI